MTAAVAMVAVKAAEGRVGAAMVAAMVAAERAAAPVAAMAAGQALCLVV